MSEKEIIGRFRAKSLRWQFWDYSAPGRYFITICTKGRRCTLGMIIKGQMKLSSRGKIISAEIKQIPTFHKRIILDESVIMPNHIHLVVTLGDYHFENGISHVGSPIADTTVGEKIHELSQQEFEPGLDTIKAYRKLRRRMIIPKVIGKFKMLASKEINLRHYTPKASNWQSNYYDHVIRNDRSFWKIRNYVIHNPEIWEEDKFYRN